MTTEIIMPKTIILHNLDRFTVEQFINNNHLDEAFYWCSGYLVKILAFSDETSEKEVINGVWRYRACDIAPFPIYKEEVQGRYTKYPVFDLTGNSMMEKIIRDIT